MLERETVVWTVSVTSTASPTSALLVDTVLVAAASAAVATSIGLILASTVGSVRVSSMAAEICAGENG